MDRAIFPGMNFDNPVFPDCLVDPLNVGHAEDTVVMATGLMSDEGVHLFLGDELVANSMSDANGNATIANEFQTHYIFG